MKNILRVFIRSSSSSPECNYSRFSRSGLSIHRFFQRREQKQEGLSMSKKNHFGIRWSRR